MKSLHVIFVFDNDGYYTGKSFYTEKGKNAPYLGVVLDKDGNTTFSFVLDEGQIFEKNRGMDDTVAEGEMMLMLMTKEKLSKMTTHKEGYVTRFIVPSLDDMCTIVENSGVYTKKAQTDPANYIWEEQYSGKMDAKFEYDKVLGEDTHYNTMMVVADKNGVYYGENWSNFGNFLFAAEAAALGYNKTQILATAHINNRFIKSRGKDVKGEWDSPDDQRSLARGYDWFHNVLSLSKILPKTNKSVSLTHTGIGIFLKKYVKPLFDK